MKKIIKIQIYLHSFLLSVFHALVFIFEIVYTYMNANVKNADMNMNVYVCLEMYMKVDCSGCRAIGERSPALRV